MKKFRAYAKLVLAEVKRISFFSCVALITALLLLIMSVGMFVENSDGGYVYARIEKSEYESGKELISKEKYEDRFTEYCGYMSLEFENISIKSSFSCIDADALTYPVLYGNTDGIVINNMLYAVIKKDLKDDNEDILEKSLTVFGVYGKISGVIDDKTGEPYVYLPESFVKVLLNRYQNEITEYSAFAFKRYADAKKFAEKMLVNGIPVSITNEQYYIDKENGKVSSLYLLGLAVSFLVMAYAVTKRGFESVKEDLYKKEYLGIEKEDVMAVIALSVMFLLFICNVGAWILYEMVIIFYN